jgi:ATP-binding cassette subfamily B protein
MKRLLPYIAPYKWKITRGLIIKFLGTVVELFLPAILTYMLDSVIVTTDIAL